MGTMTDLIECVFFFSSRRRHTRLQGDWSSDVCSSDLVGAPFADLPAETKDGTQMLLLGNIEFPQEAEQLSERGANGVGLYRTEFLYLRSEERRVGKECRSRWSPYH